MIKFFLSIVSSLLCAQIACAHTLLDRCTANMTYQGPALRADLDNISFPISEINLSRLLRRELADQLHQQFSQLVKMHTTATQASVAVWSEEHGYWASDFVTTSVGGSSNSYWWASVGKIITASIILQNVREGTLSLKDPISKWFKNYPNGDLITIDHLLTHTGGVFSFNADRKLDQQLGHKPVNVLIEASAKHGADFCPGTNWNYSNTGYVMLSHIAEQVNNQRFAELVQNRIAEPLNVTTLAVIEPSDMKDSIVLPTGEAPPGIPDIASIYGAGAVRSNATDMLVLLNAYLRGQIISVDLRSMAFQQLYPMFGSTMYYGRGVMVTDVPDPTQPTVWLGHTGGSPHAKGLVVYDVRRKVFVAMVLNVQAPAEAITHALLKVFDDIDATQRD